MVALMILTHTMSTHVFTHCSKFRAHNLIQDRLMSIVRDAGYSVTARVPIIEVHEVQDQQIRADIYLPQMQPGRSTGAVGFASMLPGFTTFMAVLVQCC